MRRQGNRILKAAAMCLLFLGALGAGSKAAYAEGIAAAGSAANEKIKAVTYFGNEWPINFWSSDFAQMEEDFSRIREDGFNSIILCVPWNEFQPRLTDEGGEFNESVIKRFREVMQKAEAADLSVLLRLGYTWDYYNNAVILERYQALVTGDTRVQDCWISYAERMYREASAFSNYGGAFLTWEDFWNYIEEAKKLAGTRLGESAAKASGYSAYVQEHYSTEKLTELYGSEKEAKAAGYPKQQSPAYRLFLEWYDEVLTALLEKTQTVFPGLSMECRLDIDPYRNTAYELEGFAHEKTFSCGDAPYTSVMLAASMGFSDGQILSPEAAWAEGRRQLQRTKAAAGKNVFVDQFLYMETTPGYENAPKLSAEDMNRYLEGIGSVFQAESIGYGIWTYRDYVDNQLYNPGFALALSGWDSQGAASVVKDGNNYLCSLKRGSSVSQGIQNRSYLADGKTNVSLRVRCDAPVSIRIETDAGTQTVSVEEGDHTVEVHFDKQAKETVKISLAGGTEARIDDVRLYSHVTEGCIYQTDGSEGPYLEGIRKLNKALS